MSLAVRVKCQGTGGKGREGPPHAGTSPGFTCGSSSRAPSCFHRSLSAGHALILTQPWNVWRAPGSRLQQTGGLERPRGPSGRRLGPGTGAKSDRAAEQANQRLTHIHERKGGAGFYLYHMAPRLHRWLLALGNFAATASSVRHQKPEGPKSNKST